MKKIRPSIEKALFLFIGPAVLALFTGTAVAGNLTADKVSVVWQLELAGDTTWASTNDAVLHFRLNDNTNSTTVVDASGQGSHGVLINAGNTEDISSSAGIVDRCFNFDGVNDEIQISDTTSSPLDITDAITIALWIMCDNFDNAGLGALISKYWDGTSSLYGYALAVRGGGELRLNLGTSTGSQRYADTTLADMSTGVWYHVAATWDKSVGSFSYYKNGSLFETLGSGFSEPIGQNNEPLHIGSNHTGTLLYDGKLDDVRIFNVALGPAEIAALYNEGVGVESSDVNVPAARVTTIMHTDAGLTTPPLGDVPMGVYTNGVQ
ncbi:MAG: LamG domain-containing protein [Lentisphaerae bacterium]|nr:LamG domain-containing protein [Lentisphaerota bacterium]